MPYEVSMSGGQPWGFRLAGGSFAGTACTISRITPGGKAAQANVMQGDVLVAINGMSISDLSLPEIMQRIKSSCEQVHMTLLSQEEIEANLLGKRQSEVNITNATDIERPASNIPPHSPRIGTPASAVTPVPPSFLTAQAPRSACASPVVVTPTPVEEKVQTPTPKPRTTVSSEQTSSSVTPNPGNEEEERRVVPDFVKRHLKPQKPLPEFKPQVNWLHGKLRINLKPNPNALNDPGNKLKTAAQAHPNQPIEIDGPLSATVVHAQYNTPVGLYSGSQIVNTLVGTAAAKGTKLSEDDVFGSGEIDVNKDTPVYRLVHEKQGASPLPAQSRSIQILDALLSTPGANIPTGFN